MNCRKVHRYLIDYFEGKLSGNEAREIDLHLQTCKKCSVFFEYSGEIISQLGESKKLDSDPYFYNRLVSRLSEKSRKKEFFLFPKYSFHLQYIVIALLISTGLFLGIILGQGSFKQEKVIAISDQTIENEEDHYLDLASTNNYFFEHEYLRTIENGNND